MVAVARLRRPERGPWTAQWGRRADFYPCGPGNEIRIPTETEPEKQKDLNEVRITFPGTLSARVPKGLVARLHLLFVLERVQREGGAVGPEVVFACIDGSGAFEFDSIKLLVDSFNSHPTVDVVFGRRPEGNSGMATGRKEIEEFEQYLLFRHRAEALRMSFEGYNFEEPLLPDGQAGCWGFRLRAAPWLPLTATGYEIEYDLLLSTLDSGLKAAFTDPLIMSDRPRHSSAGSAPVEMSLKKLQFIERKLRISREDTAEAWLAFSSHFRDSALLNNIPHAYGDALRKRSAESRGA